jgi:ATP-dependent DNA ligase
LLEDVRTGKVPETKEGVVAWHLTENKSPIKLKFTKDHDIYIRDFFPGEGKYKGHAVGGFFFSHDPDGPIVGKVGTGITDVQRLDMHENPEKYMGMVARVKAQQKYRSGALRAPSFQGWHLDKNEPDRLNMVKHAEDTLELVFLWGGAVG